MCSHIDHTEHSVDVIITEQGVADLRGLDAVQRAESIIANCAHPSYRPLLQEYLKLGKSGNIPHSLEASLAFHTSFKATGDMHDVDWSRYGF